MLTKKELEDLRPWVTSQVTAASGKLNVPVIDQALDCIGKSLSRQSTTGKPALFQIESTTIRAR